MARLPRTQGLGRLLAHFNPPDSASCLFSASGYRKCHPLPGHAFSVGDVGAAPLSGPETSVSPGASAPFRCGSLALACCRSFMARELDGDAVPQQVPSPPSCPDRQSAVAGRFDRVDEPDVDLRPSHRLGALFDTEHGGDIRPAAVLRPIPLRHASHSQRHLTLLPRAQRALHLPLDGLPRLDCVKPAPADVNKR